MNKFQNLFKNPSTKVRDIYNKYINFKIGGIKEDKIDAIKKMINEKWTQIMEKLYNIEQKYYEVLTSQLQLHQKSTNFRKTTISTRNKNKLYTIIKRNIHINS